MGEQNYLYVNSVDILQPDKLIGLSLLFDLKNANQIQQNGNIDGMYYEFSRFSSGVMVDSELAEFWKKNLIRKEIRCFTRSKPFVSKKRKSARLANIVD